MNDPWGETKASNPRRENQRRAHAERGVDRESPDSAFPPMKKLSEI